VIFMTLPLVTLSDIWSICAHFRVVQCGFLLNFDTDNCLLKNFHYTSLHYMYFYTIFYIFEIIKICSSKTPSRISSGV
jgi:hypothetical protein